MRTVALDDNPGHTVTHLFFGSGVRRGSAPGELGARRSPDLGGDGLPRRRTSRRILARLNRASALFATAAVLVVAGTSGAVAAPQPTPTPDTGEPTIVLAPLSRGVVATGGALIATLEVSNPTAAALTPASLSLEISDAPLANSDALDEWIDGGDLVGGTSVIDRPVAESIAPGDSEVIVSTVAPEVLAGRAPGVYALSASYGPDAVSRSAVVLLGESPAARSIGIVVAVTAGPQTTGLLTAEQLTTLTGPDGRLRAILDGVAGSSAILAVDPSVLASIRVLGDSAPVSALAWLDRLEALPNERFALQFGDADVSTQMDAGLTSLLEPTSLDYAMSESGFTGPASTPTPTPSPSAPAPADDSGSTDDTETTDDASLPDLEQLVAVPGARATIYWPAGGRTDERAASVLAQQPSASGAPATLLLSSNETRRSDQRAAAVSGGGVPALVYEAGSSAAVRTTAGTAADATVAASALISAQIALETSNATGPLLITTERMTEVGATALRTAIEGVFGFPGVTPASLSTLLNDEPSGAEITGQPAVEAAASLDTLLAGETQIAEFSSLIDDPSLLTAPERTALLQLIGAGWHAEPDAWQSALTAHAEATAATLASVAIQEPSTVQLVSPEAVLPFFVRNDLPYAVNVVLVSTPDSLRLDVDRTLPVRAEPGVNTRVEVPVRARVGSGEVTIELRLLSPSFEQIGPVQRAQVTVRAEWERIGIISLGAIVVLLLGAGLIRTVRRRRRARAAAEEEPTEVEGPGTQHGTKPDDE